MNPSILFLIMVALFLLLIYFPKKRAEEVRRIQRIKKLKLNRKDIPSMNELLQSYLGQECAIYTSSSVGTTGTITRIVDNWVEVTYKGQTKLLNADYISQIDINKPKVK